jgi:hypothetical protein
VEVSADAGKTWQVCEGGWREGEREGGRETTEGVGVERGGGGGGQYVIVVTIGHTYTRCSNREHNTTNKHTLSHNTTNKHTLSHNDTNKHALSHIYTLH